MQKFKVKVTFLGKTFNVSIKARDEKHAKQKITNNITFDSVELEENSSIDPTQEIENELRQMEDFVKVTRDMLDALKKLK